MQAVHVKVLTATMTQQTRFKATGLNRCVVRPLDNNLSPEANATYVAQCLLDDHNLENKDKLTVLGVGTLPDNTFAVLLSRK